MLNEGIQNVDELSLRSPQQFTEHVIIDALEGIRIVREGESNSALNLNVASGSSFSGPIDPDVLQNHRINRAQLQTHEPSLAKFLVVKLRSWLSVGYTRILSLHASYLATLDPDSFVITNKWSYRHIRSLSPCLEDVDCILISAVTERGHTQLKIKCLPHERKELLSKVVELSYYDNSNLILLNNSSTLAQTNSFDQNTFFKECERQTKFNTRQQISILCTAHGLIELDYDTLCPLKTYFYKNILHVNFLSDDSNGIMIHFTSMVCKLFFVTSSRKGGNGRSDIITVLKEKNSAIGIDLVMIESSSLEEYHNHQKAVASKNVIGDTIRSFKVMKLSERMKNKGLHGDDIYVERYLYLSENGFLVESNHEYGSDSSIDESQTRVLRCTNLSELRSIVRYREICPHRPTYEPLGLQFIDGCSRLYLLRNRDSFLASVCDVLKTIPPLHDIDLNGYRLSSKSSSIAEKICLKRLHQICYSANVFIRASSVSSLDSHVKMEALDECRVVFDACYYFIANFGASSTRGVYEEPKLAVETLQSLWSVLSCLIFKFSSGVSSAEDCSLDIQLVPILQTIYLLLSTSGTYTYIIGKSGDIAASIKQLYHLIYDPVAAYWFLNILTRYALPCEPSYDVYKRVVLDCVLNNLVDFINSKHSTELPLMAGSQFLETVLHSHRLSTHINFLTSLMRCFSPCIIRKMLQSSTRLVVENTLIFLWIISMYSEHSADVIREHLFKSGLPLRHFYFALFCPSESQRFFSRLLCSFFFSGPDNGMGKHLLMRMIPAGFLSFLNLPPLSRGEEEQLDQIDREEYEALASFPLKLMEFVSGVDSLRLNTKLAYFNTDRYSTVGFPKNNVRVLFHIMRFNHDLPDLIWNQVTRNELSVSLETELINFHRHDSKSSIVWNFYDFTICYPSLLKNEVKVGSIYLRVFMNASDITAKSVQKPKYLFDAIFRRFIFASDDDDWDTVALSLRCMIRLYHLHSATIGPIPDYVVVILRLICRASPPNIQQALWSFLDNILNFENNKVYSPMMNENSDQLRNLFAFSILCEAIALASVNLPYLKKIWYVAPENQSNLMQGPLILSDLRTLVADKELCKDWVCTIGFIDENEQSFFLESWGSLSSVCWELRMIQESADVDKTAIKGISQVALKILSNLLKSRKSVDENDCLFSPIPLAKELINGLTERQCSSIAPVGLCYTPIHPRCFLSIIFQSILGDEPQSINDAADILRVFLEFNKYGCGRFYNSGYFHILLISLDHFYPHALTIINILSYVLTTIDTTDKTFDIELFNKCVIVSRLLKNYAHTEGHDLCKHEIRAAITAVKKHIGDYSVLGPFSTKDDKIRAPPSYSPPPCPAPAVK